MLALVGGLVVELVELVLESFVGALASGVVERGNGNTHHGESKYDDLRFCHYFKLFIIKRLRNIYI